MVKGRRKKKNSSTATKTHRVWNDALPQKMAQKFKQCVKAYENEQYDASLKAANHILDKCPKNGETLSMKGLILQAKNKWEEAKPFIEAGLENNKNSRTCWNIFGLMKRRDSEWQDAIKAFKKAHDIEPAHSRITADLATLQCQVRDFKGYMETRKKILSDRSNLKASWLFYGIASFLCENYPTALQVFENFDSLIEKERSQKQTKNGKPPKLDPKDKYERSELLLFKVVAKERWGQLEDALELLDEKKDEICDRKGMVELKIRILEKLGKKRKSFLERIPALWKALLEINVENTDYHEGYLKSLNLDRENEDDCKKILSFYSEMQAKYPKSVNLKRRPLDFVNGDEFKLLVGEYLMHQLRRSVSALFSDLKPLYLDKRKITIIEELVLGYISELEKHNRFLSSEKADSQDPCCYLWAKFYLANHYHYLEKDLEALKQLDELIGDIPTTPEFYILKAQIYKHGGDHTTAYKWMDQARVLDKADRYLNTKCCRYALRAGEIEKAEETVALFLRDGDELTGLQTLQVMWYETNKGMAHLKLGHLGQAIKEFQNIASHFTQIFHDQLDFHNYAVRKLTFRTYLSMLEWQDNLRNHPFFRIAAEGAVDAYLQIYEQRRLITEGQPPPKNNEYKYKRSKPPTRVDNKPDNWNDKPQPKEDLDPWGTKLFEHSSPLDECQRLFVAPFEAHCGSKVMLSKILFARLHLATGKLALVSKALLQARVLDKDHPLVLYLTTSLIHKTEGPKKADVPSMVRQLVIRFKPKLLDCETIVEHIRGVLSRHENSLAHLLAVYRSIKLLDLESPEPIAERFAQSVADCKLADAQEASKELSESPAKENFLAECRKRFPLAVFCKLVVE